MIKSNIKYLLVFLRYTNLQWIYMGQYIRDLSSLRKVYTRISNTGLHIMRAKFIKGIFGSCPRVLCERQLTLPIGMSEELSTSRVKVIFKLI